MPSKLDLLKRDAELAKEHLIRKAYEAAAGRPDSELKRACDLLDAALHRVYCEHDKTIIAQSSRALRGWRREPELNAGLEGRAEC